MEPILRSALPQRRILFFLSNALKDKKQARKSLLHNTSNTDISTIQKTTEVATYSIAFKKYQLKPETNFCASPLKGNKTQMKKVL